MRTVAGVVGFLVGAVCGLLFVKVGCQAVWACRYWFHPPTGEEFEYLDLMAALLVAEFTLYIPTAVVFGAIGCWVAVRGRGRSQDRAQPDVESTTLVVRPERQGSRWRQVDSDRSGGNR